MRKAKTTIILTIALFAAFMVGQVSTAEAHKITTSDCYKAAKASGYPYKSYRWKVVFNRCINYARTHAAKHACENPPTPLGAINCVFPVGSRAGAWSVAICESTANDSTPYPDHGIYAQNGQYRGIFQMGSNERATYGDYVVGSRPIVQVRSAYRYWDASGRDWSPWECKP